MPDQPSASATQSSESPAPAPWTSTAQGVPSAADNSVEEGPSAQPSRAGSPELSGSAPSDVGGRTASVEVLTASSLPSNTDGSRASASKISAQPVIKHVEARQAQGAAVRRAASRAAFAEKTLTRFNAKLTGLVEQLSETGERSLVQQTVEEQVERLLKAATSLDNLAQMYEGWTPWL